MLHEFVRLPKEASNVLQVSKYEIKEELKFSNVLKEFHDMFMDDIPSKLPPKREIDDHSIPKGSPPNNPPYRIPQAQQDKIMRQVC